MSDTDRRAPWRPFAKESKRTRRVWKRRRRAHVRSAIRRGDHEQASQRWKGSEGWMTW